MKHHVIALAASAMLLAGCSDEPRGPLEVQGKTFHLTSNDGASNKLNFSGREKGRSTNLHTGKSVDFQYTLVGDKLTVQDEGGSESFEFKRRGKRFGGDGFVLEEMTQEDEKRLTEAAEQRKQQEKALAQRLTPQGAPADASAYTLLDELADESNHSHTWVVVAWQLEPIEDEELLRLFSLRWVNTKDSFERQAMRTSELERIKKRLAEVRKITYVRIPWDRELTQFEMNLQQSSSDDAYDFEKKSFRLKSYMCTGEMTGLTHTSTNALYSVKHDPAFCWLPVPEEDVARRIESARTSSKGVHIRSTVFAKIAGLDGNQIVLVPVALELPIYNGNHWQREVGEPLAEFSLWPYKHR